MDSIPPFTAGVFRSLPGSPGIFSGAINPGEHIGSRQTSTDHTTLSGDSGTAAPLKTAMTLLFKNSDEMETLCDLTGEKYGPNFLPVVVGGDNTVYSSTFIKPDNSWIIFALKDGKDLWQHKIGSARITSSPALGADGTLYATLLEQVPGEPSA